MRDGRTHKLKTTAPRRSFEQFLQGYRAVLIAVSGGASGTEFELGGPRTVIGRGPGADLAVENPTMSRQHAAVEYAGNGFRVVDLGSTNGIHVNGEPVQVADLRHGDLLEVGAQVFQLVIDERDEPDVYDLDKQV